MPVSQGSAGGLPGLNLKAWAHVNNSGVLLRGFNVAGASRVAVGEYQITLSNPVSVRPVCKLAAERPGYFSIAVMSSATVVSVSTSNVSVSTDAGFYIEVYD